MQYTVHNAKTQLSKLIDAALAGEEVVIAKGQKPAVRLVALPQSGFAFDTHKGALGVPPDFFEPLSEAELADWE